MSITIQKQPVSKTVNQGESTFFEVIAISVGNPSTAVKYQWQEHDGKTWIYIFDSGKNNGQITPYLGTELATLQIISIPYSMNGKKYRCMVSDMNQSVYTNEVTLTVEIPPHITKHPVDITVNSGQDATFSVTADGTNLIYQWQKAPGNTWANIEGSASTLKISSVNVDLNGCKYRCIVSNVTDKSVTSNQAKLTVKAPPSTMPVITTQPKNITVNDGGDATFSLTATGSNLKYQWYVSNNGVTWLPTSDSGSGTSTSYSGSNTNTLKISKVAAYMNGYKYCCKVSNSATGENVTSNEVTLTVTVAIQPTPPVIITHPINKTVIAGQNTEFSVVATGNPAPEYQWLYYPNGSNSGLNVPNAPPYSGVYTNKLSITNVAIGLNGYKFSCFVSNMAGRAISNDATLTVQIPQTPPVITKHPSSQTVISGQNATFSISATGVPTPTLQWQRSTDNGLSWSDLSGATSANLTISAVTSASNGYRYRCIASNGVLPNATSNSATLTVVTKWGTTPNLIVNGDAEQSTMGWNPDRNNPELENNRGPGEGVTWRTITKPDQGSNQSTLRAASGSWFFTPKLNVTLWEQHTDLSQIVDVSKFSNWIDTGQQSFDISGNYCADGGDDKAQIFIKMLNASGSVLSNSSSSKTNNKNWSYYNLSGFKLPVNARKIKIVLRASKSWGHQHYCSYFDSLQLSMPLLKIPVTVSAYTVPVGSTVKITPDAGFNFSGIGYESLTPAIASVDSSGNVKGLSPGTAKIKIKDPKLPEVVNEIIITVIGTAPAITTQPANQTINSGQNATFSISATGVPTPTLQWQRSTDNGLSWSNLSGATSANLTISAVTSASNGYRYRCIASNGVLPNATSNSATLTVQTAPAITTQPANQTIISGQNATFSVSATGNPAPIYQWQVQAKGTTSWINIPNTAPYSGTTSATLTITGVTNALDGYKYRCVATNAAGSVTSNAVTLTVVAAGIAPTITTHPSDVTVAAILIPKFVTFTVAAKGDPKLMYQWQESPTGKLWTNIGNMKPYSGENTEQLTIAKPTTKLNGYKYRCVVTNAAGSITTNAATLTVVTAGATGAPIITIHPSDVTVATTILIKSVTFTVAAKGDPKLMYQWQESPEGKLWTNIGNIKPYSGENAEQLTIAKPTTTMNGYKYRCVVANSAGSATSNAATLTLSSKRITLTETLKITKPL
jgi:hypothetical protein